MNNKTTYNVAGTVIGAVLAAIAIFLTVQTVSGQQQTQEHSQLITYNS